MAKFGYMYAQTADSGYTLSAVFEEGTKLLLRHVSYRDKRRLLNEMQRDGAITIRSRRVRTRRKVPLPG